MIRPVLAAIYDGANADSFADDPSLLGGQAGSLLFNFLHLQHLGIAEDPAFEQRLQQLAEDSINQAYPTFCGGFSGTSWLFAYLHNKKILSDEDREALSYRDRQLETTSLGLLDNGFYDFLHGAIGIAWYLLYSGSNTSPGYFAAFLAKLSALTNTSTKKDSIPYYDFVKYEVHSYKTNLGLAHGIPSVLKFCIQCFKQNICPDQSRQLARQIIDYLLSHTNADTTGSYFSNVVEADQKPNTTSRLAWCYGDLGVGFILYQAGRTFNDQPLIDFSLKVLLHSTKRREPKATMLVDTGVCHGTAGLAHIYNRLWHHTHNPEFKESCDHWVQRTIDWGKEGDTFLFRRFASESRSYEIDNSLLSGSIGVGLVLLSCLTGDFSWDYCLMLND